jgi:pimeloyl-ACP methyl ester carboxylesterase
MDKIKLTCNSYAINVFHRAGRSDEKIVFLHGGGLDSAMLSWKEVIGLMDSRYDIYAIDLLGYGESDKPDILYSTPMYVELVHNVFDQLHIEKTSLVGLSMGGGISIAFSLKYPEMINKLAFIGSVGLYQRMPFHTLCRWYAYSRLNSKSYEWLGKSKKFVRWSIAASLIGDKSKITDELTDGLYDLLQQPNVNRAFESFQRYEMGKKKITTDLTPHLGELKIPVLIVNGEKDSGVPAKFAIAAGKVIKNSRVHIMKDCKHWAQKERPEEFAECLSEFLQSKEPLLK